MNKKILNATPQEYSGVKFKSKIEAMVYKVLKENGFDPRYEEHTYTLWEGYRSTVPFYTKSSPRNRGSSGWNKLNLSKLRDITYTPDFYMEHKGLKIIIEVKGNVNDFLISLRCSGSTLSHCLIKGIILSLKYLVKNSC